MVGCIAYCFFIGFYIDKWLKTKGVFLTIFIILGVIGGGITVYRQILEMMEENNNKKKVRQQTLIFLHVLNEGITNYLVYLK